MPRSDEHEQLVAVDTAVRRDRTWHPRNLRVRASGGNLAAGTARSSAARAVDEQARALQVAARRAWAPTPARRMTELTEFIGRDGNRLAADGDGDQGDPP